MPIFPEQYLAAYNQLIRNNPVLYENKTCSIEVSKIESTEYNMQMKNQKYQLSDAINALQLLSGFHVNSGVFLEITIGLDYVINIMKSLQ